VQDFDAETEQGYPDEQGQLEEQEIAKWPIRAGLIGVKEYTTFLEWAKHLNNYRPNIKNVSLQHLHCNPLRYQTKL
jgi:hypothetical protein